MSSKKDSPSVQFYQAHDSRYQDSTFPRSALAHRNSSSSASVQVGAKTKQVLSLISFIRKYSSSLPIRVSVVEGYSGRDDR